MTTAQQSSEQLPRPRTSWGSSFKKNRDSQRSKVYRAENVIHISSRSLQQQGGPWSIAQCQAYANKMLADKWVQRTFTRARSIKIHVEAGRGGGRAWGFGHIQLGTWARQPSVIIHEVAHLLCGTGYGHHWEFCEVYLLLVRHFLGAEKHEQLKASFKAHGVRYSQPRQPRELSDAERAALRDRLAAARNGSHSTVVVSAGTSCRKCGTEHGVGKGGSYGHPLCDPCYRAWRKALRS